jgi:hypothetical protein
MVTSRLPMDERIADKYTNTCHRRIRGAMVARLTPDQKVACSIHVGFNTPVQLGYLF